MDREIPGHIAGYAPMNPGRPDPWDTSAAARIAEENAAFRELGRRAARLMPEDEQEDAEPSPYAPRSGAGACVGGIFVLAALVGFCACGAWALFGPWVGGGRP